MPPSMLSTVVLPAPEGPTMMVNSPLSTVKSTPSTALIVTSPIRYSFFTFSKDM